MQWSITYDHLKMPSYNMETNRFAAAGIVKEDYVPFSFKGDLADQVLKNYCLFSVTYQPFVREVFEFEDYLVFVMHEIPEERMELVCNGLFPAYETVNDNMIPFMFCLTDVYALPSTIQHLNVDGEDITLIKRFFKPKACEDDSVYTRINQKFGESYSVGAMIVIDYSHITEEIYTGHINDFVLHMLDKRVSNRYEIFDINKFVNALVAELDSGNRERFDVIRQTIVLTSELQHTPEPKKKKRWS